MFEFYWPYAFAVLALPLLVWLYAEPLKRMELALYVPKLNWFQLDQSAQSTTQISSKLLVLLVMLGWISLAAALARPQWTGEAKPLPTLHRDLVLVLDISGSMGNTDMRVGNSRYTRLAVAKHVLREFISGRTGDRIGVLLFGTQPYVYVPLTSDTEAASTMLQDAPIGIAGRATAIGDSLGLAVKQLVNHPAEHRIVILLTDGNSNAGELTPKNAAELAASYDVKIYTIGLIPESGVSNFFGNVFQLNSSDLDLDLLREIAAITAGKFFQASDVEDLLAIYEEIDQLEPIETDSVTVRPVKSLFQIPLFVALLCFSLVGLIKLRGNV